MFFWLKKFIAFWLMPLPMCLALLLGGLALVRSKRRSRLGYSLIAASTLLLLLLGNKAVSTALIRPLETVYPAVPELAAGQPVPPALAACRFVAVLGGGHGDTPGLSAVNKLSGSARGRLMEGIRLLRALPDAQLIVSGGGEDGQLTHAAILASAAVSLGVDPARIIRLETARDTEDEAREIHRVVGGAPFALVTSAWHLRRATALMRGAGLHPLPCPSDYAVRPSPGFRVNDYTWDTDSLDRSTKAVYERLGYLWVRLRGKV
jgi:uncharacterized SAM-binding protein YcdF (DUF218 family)